MQVSLSICYPRVCSWDQPYAQTKIACCSSETIFRCRSCVAIDLNHNDPLPLGGFWITAQEQLKLKQSVENISLLRRWRVETTVRCIQSNGDRNRIQDCCLLCVPNDHPGNVIRNHERQQETQNSLGNTSR